jgi:UDP-N-acetylglucosamine/UDP-N-acetylgalactosamine 4-epimerase
MLVVAPDVRVKRFLCTASSPTFSDHPDLPKTEDKINGLHSLYAVKKVADELYAGVFA